MNINEIIKNLDLTKAFITMLLGSGIVQISPIKINPCSALVKWIGDVACSSTKEDISILSDRIGKLEQEQTETQNKLQTSIAILQQTITKMDKKDERREMENIRRHILSFYEELKRDDNISTESFRSTLSDIDAYEKYCNENKDFKNGYTLNAVTIIKQKSMEKMGGGIS